MYYIPEERLNIGRRVFTQEISKEKAASEYNISITTVVNYVKDSQESIFEELTDYKLIELLRRMKTLHFTNENLYTPCASDDEIIKACEIFNVPIIKEELPSEQIQKIIKMKL